MIQANLIYLQQYSTDFVLTARPAACSFCGESEHIEPIDQFGIYKHFCLNCGAVFIKNYNAG